MNEGKVDHIKIPTLTGHATNCARQLRCQMSTQDVENKQLRSASSQKADPRLECRDNVPPMTSDQQKMTIMAEHRQ